MSNAANIPGKSMGHIDDAWNSGVGIADSSDSFCEALDVHPPSAASGGGFAADKKGHVEGGRSKGGRAKRTSPERDVTIAILQDFLDDRSDNPLKVARGSQRDGRWTRLVDRVRQLENVTPDLPSTPQEALPIQVPLNFKVKRCKKRYSDVNRNFKKQEAIARRASGLGTLGDMEDEDHTRNLEEELVWKTMRMEEELKKNRVVSTERKTREYKVARVDRDSFRKNMEHYRQVLQERPPNCIQNVPLIIRVDSGDVTGAPSVTQKMKRKGPQPPRLARSTLGGSSGPSNVPGTSGGKLYSVLFDMEDSDSSSGNCSIREDEPGGSGCDTDQENVCSMEGAMTCVAQEGASWKSKLRGKGKRKAR